MKQFISRGKSGYKLKHFYISALPIFIPRKFSIRKERHLHCLLNKQNYSTKEVHLITQLKLHNQIPLRISWREDDTKIIAPHLVKPFPEYTEW